jgi:hypothetical protein
MPSLNASASPADSIGNRADGISATKTYTPPATKVLVMLGRPLIPMRIAGDGVAGITELFIFETIVFILLYILIII